MAVFVVSDRVCGGRNRTCALVSSTFHLQPNGVVGYKKIIRIPPGSTNVKIQDNRCGNFSDQQVF